MSFFSELKRRNVIKVALFYAIASWLIIQVAETVLPLFDMPESMLRGLVIVLSLGFLPALVFAWIFELTPEGIKKEAEIDRERSVTGETGGKLNLAIVVLLLLTLGLMAYQTFVGNDEPDRPSLATTPQAAETAPDSDTGTERPSIAVLPFRDMSAAGDQDYFAEGIAEELLNALVKVDGLRVASRTSAFSFKGKDLDLPSIARSLQVNHILEGSVRTSGDKIRVTAQLINVSSDAHLWSETFDSKLDDVFAIQDRIAARVVSELKARLVGETPLAPASATLTENSAAYRLYLQGRFHWRQRSGESITQAIDEFEQAVALDPDFAKAWANLAVAYRNLPFYAGVEQEIYFEKAEAAAERALSLNANLGEALAVRADLAVARCDFLTAERNFRAAAAAEPDDPTVHHWYGNHLSALGHQAEGRKELDRAYALDPLNAAIVVSLGDIALIQGDYAVANTLIEEARQLGFMKKSSRILGGAAAIQGDFDRARTLLAQVQTLPWTDNVDYLDLLVDAMQSPAAKPAFEQRLSNYYATGVFRSPGSYVSNMAMIGSPLLTRGLAEKDYFADFSGYVWLQSARDVSQSPEFFIAAKRIGMVAYWQEFGWPDGCQAAEDHLVCSDE